MIDYVNLNYPIIISNKQFSSRKWKAGQTDDGQPYYWHTIRGVKLKYYTESQLFTIKGKIINLLHDTQVQNFDDIYGARRDLFIDEVNTVLNRLFPSPMIDIRNFTVTKIDYCFNVETPNVKIYTNFLQKAFRMSNSGTRIDHTEAQMLTGSVYDKTTSDYKANQNKNYTLNFYDKSDWVQNKLTEGRNISDADVILAQNQLRLEVQCGHQMIKRQCNKFNVNNTFGELFDFKIAYDAILTAYTLVFKATEETDYFTYVEAKKLLKGHPAAQKVLWVASSHKVTDPKYAYGRKLVRQMGVYPYCFLDKNGSIPHLENPMKLLLKKFSSIGVLSD